ncbi:MAG: polysaccharide biosynthesis/export family protein [Collimonas fungivorans]|uniref:polysaccharide biosynthesis/export family protein n=1 Tax=Collimonas fungivorans TaxID=158899 RepID=UPI0026F11C83|nr:polysaccharide biosynthesis/export family protein [Collimonas fungivorans]MDB5766327.1 polysaccharide biosynthesis/export family protein [Collimonas fungivorans]
MASSFKTYLRRWGIVALAFCLSACVTVPGMRMDEAELTAQEDAGPSMLRIITPRLLQEEQLSRTNRADPDLAPLLGKPTPYLIGNGDILSITVWDHPELVAPMMAGIAQGTAAGIGSGTTPGFVVDQNGLVQFPYVGLIKLAGLTEADARSALTEQLGRYFKKPNLTLRVQAYRSQRVYVSGEVKTQGIQTINDIPMTLAEALNRAEGVLPTGDATHVEISRAGKNYRVNLPLLVRKGMDPAAIMLAGGDAIRIFPRDDSKVFVLGEVSHPVTLTLRDGQLSLAEALGEAGGLNPLTSDGRQVYVVRGAAADAAQPQVYHLDARSPVAFIMAERFQLQAKDVVYVDAAPLALWSRVVSLVIPSAQSVTSAVQAGK